MTTKHLLTIAILFISSLYGSAQDLNNSSTTKDTLWIDNGSRHIFGIRNSEMSCEMAFAVVKY